MEPKIIIPMKDEGQKLHNHQTKLSDQKTVRFARVREILGGYSTSELLELLVDKIIEQYDDGQEPNPRYLPKQLKED